MSLKKSDKKMFFESKPLKTKSICCTQSSASLTDDAQNW